MHSLVSMAGFEQIHRHNNKLIKIRKAIQPTIVWRIAFLVSDVRKDCL